MSSTLSHWPLVAQAWFSTLVPQQTHGRRVKDDCMAGGEMSHLEISLLGAGHLGLTWL